MKDMIGFEVFEVLMIEEFLMVIFIIVYDKYVIKVFDVFVFDYLLKLFKDECFYLFVENVLFNLW